MPQRESHIAEGLGMSHALSETSVKMGYVGFCLVSPQPHSPQYPTVHIWIPHIHPLQTPSPTSNYLLLAHFPTLFHPRFIHVQLPHHPWFKSIYYKGHFFPARHLEGKEGQMNNTEPLPKRSHSPVGEAATQTNNYTEEINKP